MHALELVLFLLTAVAASSILEKLLPRLSLPLVQIGLGALIALFVHTPLESGLDPELLLILFIAPLHFNESRHADSGALWENRWGIASLAAGLVFAIIVSVGCALHALLPAIPLAAALALGAAMGSTDAPAVTELTKDLRFGRRHASLLTGEAFFNDVSGTVVFQCAIAFAASGAFSLAHAGEEFVLDLFGGLIGGALMGGLAWLVLEGIRRLGIDGPTLHVTLELLLPFLIYLAAEQLHIGGVIAVVAAGMAMSLLPHRHNAQTARQKLQSKSVWETIAFILNGVIFVILGMQLPRLLAPMADGGASDALGAISIIVVLTIILEAVRFIWIAGLDLVHHLIRERTVRGFFTASEMRETLAMAFTGAKGGITLSLMLTVPATLVTADGTPLRDMLIPIASGVILCTILLANFAVPALVPYKHEKRRSRQRTDAEIELVERVIRSIQADAHLTGSVKGEQLCADEVAADEPATAIVMKRYADRLRDLASHASKDAAASARTLADECDSLYGGIDEIADAVADLGAFGDEMPEDADGDDGGMPSLSAYFRGMQSIYRAVEDVQAQALARELDYIKEMRASGRLLPEQARTLRDDVYLQQMTL